MSEVLVQEIDLNTDGEWVECRLKECNLMFYKRPVGHKYHNLGDKLEICPLCLHDKKMSNGTTQNMRDVIINYHHKNVDSKPESDSL